MAAMQSYDEPLDWLVKIKASSRDVLEFILISLLHIVLGLFFFNHARISKLHVHFYLPAYLVCDPLVMPFIPKTVVGTQARSNEVYLVVNQDGLKNAAAWA